MSVAHGKRFEETIKRKLDKLPYHWKRIKTRQSGFKNDNEIADFYVFAHGQLLYLETKSTLKSTFPFSSIQPSQLLGLYEANKFSGVSGGILVEFLEHQTVYYLDITVVEEVLKTRKSITHKQAQELGLAVDINTDFITAIIEEVSTWNQN